MKGRGRKSEGTSGKDETKESGDQMAEGNPEAALPTAM